jgi:hypothetical protein
MFLLITFRGGSFFGALLVAVSIIGHSTNDSCDKAEAPAIYLPGCTPGIRMPFS